MTTDNLPSGVRFEGVVWADEDDDARRRLDMRIPGDRVVRGPVTERQFAVARYIALETWRIDIAWEPLLPPRGPGELSIYPLDYHLDATDDGIPSTVMRIVPFRHARKVLAAEIGRRWMRSRLDRWSSETYESDEDWAKLAMACVTLAEQGQTDLGGVLSQVWPPATAATWSSRIHRLREGTGRGYLVSDASGKLMLSPEATRLAFAAASNQDIPMQSALKKV